MKLLKMELENFRQYYGKQSIEFASNNRENTTIIFGENGKGKTGIYRAIMFVLFGSTHISQDSENEKIHLTNFKLLSESQGVAESSVRLIFEHENKKYEIFRTRRAFQSTPMLIEEREGKVEFTEIDLHTGNIKPEILTDKQEVALKINKIINEDIKDFFLFDAEKIDTLAKTDSSVRKEVKDAIFNLLQLDKVDKGTKLLNELKREVKNALDKNMESGNIKQVSAHKDKLEQSIEELNEEISKLEDQSEKTYEIIAKHEASLEKNKDIFKTKDNLEEKKQEVAVLLDQQSINISSLSDSLFEKGPVLLLEDVFYNNQSYLENYLGDEKVNIPKEILTESLNDSKCIICDHELAESNRKYIQALLDSQRHSKAYDLARDILRYATDHKESYSTNLERFNDDLQNYKNLSLTIDRENEKIESMNNEISTLARNTSDLKDIQEMIEKERENYDNLLKESGVSQNKLTELMEEKVKIDIDYQELLRKEGTNQFNTDKYMKLDELEESLKSISFKFSDDVRELLGQYTSELFKTLIDKKDLNVIDRVEIDKKFQIRAINGNGHEVTQDISQGQRQILSLSFITALARVAARENSGNRIDYPLFMDSPFNRLSGQNRDNLISNIPDLTSQWILLVTDTEWTTNEEKVLKNEKRLGKWYRINQIETHYSEIEVVGLDETMATRGVN